MYGDALVSVGSGTGVTGPASKPRATGEWHAGPAMHCRYRGPCGWRVRMCMRRRCENAGPLESRARPLAWRRGRPVLTAGTGATAGCRASGWQFRSFRSWRSVSCMAGGGPELESTCGCVVVFIIMAIALASSNTIKDKTHGQKYLTVRPIIKPVSY